MVKSDGQFAMVKSLAAAPSIWRLTIAAHAFAAPMA
jgi:hypothetical protein